MGIGGMIQSTTAEKPLFAFTRLDRLQAGQLWLAFMAVVTRRLRGRWWLMRSKKAIASLHLT